MTYRNVLIFCYETDYRASVWGKVELRSRTLRDLVNRIDHLLGKSE